MFEPIVHGYGNPCFAAMPSYYHAPTLSKMRGRRPSTMMPTSRRHQDFYWPAFSPTVMPYLSPVMPGVMETPWPSACPFIAAPVNAASEFDVSNRSEQINRDILAMRQMMHNLYAGYERSVLPQLSSIPYRPVNSLELLSMISPVRPLVNFLGGSSANMSTLWLCFDVSGFRPDEINVTFNKAEHSIIIEADCQVKPTPEEKHHQMSKHYYRKFNFPEGLKSVDMTKVEIKSHLTPSGLLVIEALLPQMTRDDRHRYLESMTKHYPLGDYITATSPFGGWPTNMAPVTCKIVA